MTTVSPAVNSTDTIGALIYHYGGFGLITCVNIPGNLLVISTFLRHEALRKPANFFIVGLACSDLCLGVVYPLYTISHIHNKDIASVLGSWSVCNGIVVALLALLFCSSFHLLGITITRFFAIVKPIYYRVYLTERVAVCGVLGIWMVSIGTSFLIYFNDDPEADYNQECMYEKLFGVKRISLLFVLALVIPLLIMVGLYIKIARIARKHVRRRKNNTNYSIGNYGSEWKSTITGALLLGVYATIWTPMCIYFYADYFCDGCIQQTPYVRATIRILVYMNTAVNVFIYSQSLDCFRNAVKKDIKRFCCKRRKPTDNHVACSGKSSSLSTITLTETLDSARSSFCEQMDICSSL